MDRYSEHRLLQRRTFLGRSARGLGAMALASMIRPGLALADSGADRWRGVVNPPHVRARAEGGIFLCLAGGPSHLVPLDPKPMLAEMHGQPMPGSFTEGM